ncbi:MAG: Nramp family divalent metal transporter [Verrucomicrobia bacterium]|nr:Nramp family divalent metal transporter [Verrucomicrobiota bacterium]
MDAIRYPDLPKDLQRGLSWSAIKYFGAGAVIASVTIGSGETLFASRGGAVFGYTLLWCFVASALMKGVQVYTAARYMVLTGEHPMTHWAAMPGPRGWAAISMAALCLFCFPFWLAALPLALGDLLNWIFNVEATGSDRLALARVWGTINVAIIVTLTLLQSYEILEKAQSLIMGLLLFCIVIATFAARPDWLAALQGIVIPQVPANYPDWIQTGYPSIASRAPWLEIGVYLGAIGGGVYDYVGYLSLYREKLWGALALKKDRFEVGLVSGSPATLPVDESPTNLARAKRWLIPAAVDTGIGFALVLIFTLCFVLLGAAILHPAHVAPAGNDLLTHQAQFLTRIHPSLLFLYQIGIFFAFWGTIYGAYEVYSRTAFECLAPVSTRVRTTPYPRFRLAILAYTVVLGLTLMWTMDDPIKIASLPAIVGGVFACGLWCFAMIWTERRFLPKPLQMPRALLALNVVAGIVLTATGLYALVEFFKNAAGH